MTGVVSAVREIAAVALCAVACVFAVAGTAGLFRFPDPYTRLQASSLAGTTAPFSVLLAALAYAPDAATASRVILILCFFFVSSPTTTHIIARYAWKSGIDPWAPSKGKGPSDPDPEAASAAEGES